MNKNLIAVSSKIGGGKDTFFNILNKKSDKQYENKKFAWKLKEIAEKLTGIPALDFEKEDVKNSYLPEEWNYIDASGNEQRLTAREFMQKLGTEGLRNNLHQNVWVNSLFANYKPYTFDSSNYHTMPNWFISDCRFPNEALAIKKRGGIIVRINRIYTWEQFCKLYGVSCISPITPESSKQKVSFWARYIKGVQNSSEEIQTALKKINHSSETSLDDYNEFDYIIENDGTVEDFENKIEKCLQYFQITEKCEIISNENII